MVGVEGSWFQARRGGGEAFFLSLDCMWRLGESEMGVGGMTLGGLLGQYTYYLFLAMRIGMLESTTDHVWMRILDAYPDWRVQKVERDGICRGRHVDMQMWYLETLN